MIDSFLANSFAIHMKRQQNYITKYENEIDDVTKIAVIFSRELQMITKIPHLANLGR